MQAAPSTGSAVTTSRMFNFSTVAVASVAYPSLRAPPVT